MQTIIGEIPDQYIIHEITEPEFRHHFPDKWVSDISGRLMYLDNGEIIDIHDWNGEVYSIGAKEYLPLYQSLGGDDYKIIGYIQR